MAVPAVETRLCCSRERMHQCPLCVISESLHGTVLCVLCTRKQTCIWAAVRFLVPALLTSTVLCVCVCVCGIDICVFLIGVLISTP